MTGVVPEAAEQRLQKAQQHLQHYLRDRGLRATRQRDLVLEVFLGQDSHLSAEELYALVRGRDPGIGFATVYRCMNLFVAAGLAYERRFHEGRVRYEPAVGAHHHDHLVCLRCGDIQEFEDATIETLQVQIAQARGFAVQYHRMELYGLCSACATEP